MVAPFVFLFLTRAILRVTSTEMHVKTANVTVKKKSLLWNHPPAARSSTWVLNIMTSIIDKSADYENCDVDLLNKAHSHVFLLKNYFLTW